MKKQQKIQTLKGFRDFLPKQALKREWLKEKITQVFQNWGYEPLETPTLEPLELFAGQIGEDEKLFYKFKDNGGRDVALRYDQTVPTCRVMSQYQGQLTFPFKRYQIQPAFRAEKPQRGRYREFLQCDADIFGVTSPLADAEVIALSLDIYRQIGFKNAKALINDREMLKDLPYPAIASIDKIEKIGEDGVIKDMMKKNISSNDAKKYLDIVKNLKPNKTIKTILNYLKDYGFDKSWYEFDPSIARSFSYSSGPIWEIVIPGFKGSVLGGERFDNLTKQISGVDIPGTGFGLGFDRTLEAAEQFGLLPDQATKTQVLVTIFDEKSLQASLQTAAKLRRAGIKTELYPQIDKLAKQFKYANRKKIPFVAIIGEEEIANNTIAVKDMSSGDQESLNVDEIVEKLVTIQLSTN